MSRRKNIPPRTAHKGVVTSQSVSSAAGGNEPSGGRSCKEMDDDVYIHKKYQVSCVLAFENTI